MKASYFLLIVISLATNSCDFRVSKETSENPSENNEYVAKNESNYSSDDIEKEHPNIEVIDSGQVKIEEYIEEDKLDENSAEKQELSVEFVGYIDLTSDAEEKMKALCSDTKYQRKNGRLKRLKIARQLNREGFRKNNGNRFKIRDIPKYY